MPLYKQPNSQKKSNKHYVFLSTTILQSSRFGASKSEITVGTRYKVLTNKPLIPFICTPKLFHTRPYQYTFWVAFINLKWIKTVILFDKTVINIRTWYFLSYRPTRNHRLLFIIYRGTAFFFCSDFSFLRHTLTLKFEQNVFAKTIISLPGFKRGALCSFVFIV